MRSCSGQTTHPWLYGGLVFLCLCLGLVPYAEGAFDDAGQAGSFLNYGAGARAIAMGRAFTGLADDATAVYWNPAGLSSAKQNQAMLQYVTLIDGNSYQYLGYNHIFSYFGTLGLGLVLLNQGEAEGRGYENELTSNFKNNQLGVLLGFGSDITSQLSAGGTVKLVSQTLMNRTGTGFGLDAGLLYHPWIFLNLGFYFQNILAPALTLKEVEERYPMHMAFGVGTRLLDDQLKADLDISKNMEQNKIKPRFGVEVTPMSNLFLRAGLDDTEIGLGAGYNYMGFQLDYALGLQTVEMMHKVTLSYFFGGFTLEVMAEPKSFSPVGINKVSVLKIHCQTKFQIRIWKLEIFNEANALVKNYTGEGSPPDHVVWDGLMDSANPMPDGKYKVVLTVEDATGESHTAPEEYVTIRSILPLGVSPVEME